MPRPSGQGPYHTSAVRSLLTAFAVGALALTCFSQQPKVLAPHKPIAPRVTKPVKWLTPATRRSMVGGLWITDANLKSSIYLKNIVETDPITVTPILHLSNGAKYTLPDVTLQSAGTAIIDINQGLQQQGIASYASLSGYAELQYTWPWDPFCATIRTLDTAHSLIFTYSLRPTLPPPLNFVNPVSATPTNTIEGMWWKQERNVTGFVALANISSLPMQVTVQVTDNQANLLASHSVTVSPQGMKLVNLDELQSSSSVQGGILITSSATTDNLIVNGGLEDQSVGYSANLPFATDPLAASGPTPTTIAELGLMSGAADPMMLFPAGTTFTPYSVLRNVSDAPISVTPKLWWMAGGVPHSAPVPPVSIPPHQTQSLDVMSLLGQAGLISATTTFNGSFNLVLDATIKPGALLLASGSVDRTSTYVFEVIARGVAESGSKSLQYWSTGNGDDTMVTLWNPADEAQDFVLTLFFALPNGGGHYLWPLHLEARATRTFNVSEIVQNQIPDSEGNIIPAVVHEGGIKIAGSQAENQAILVAVDSGIYNVSKATCTNNCQECDGYSEAAALLNPFGVAVRATTQLNFRGTWGSGTQYNLSGTWSSNNTAVATVGGSSGLVTGVSAGSPRISVYVDNLPVQAGYICTGPLGCPTTTFADSPSGTVLSVYVDGKSYIFVGNDANELFANRFRMYGDSGFTEDPQPTGGTSSASSSDTSDAITQFNQHPPGFQFQSSDQSSAAGDRTLTFTYALNGQSTSAHQSVTARKFAYLTNDNPSNQCTTTYGTLRDYTYTVYTHPDHAAVLPGDNLQGTAASENFNPTLVCQTIQGNGNLNANGQLIDHISSGCSNSPLTCTQTSTQTIGVAGYLVRTNTLQWTSSQVAYTNGGPTQ